MSAMIGSTMWRSTSGRMPSRRSLGRTGNVRRSGAVADIGDSLTHYALAEHKSEVTNPCGRLPTASAVGLAEAWAGPLQLHLGAVAEELGRTAGAGVAGLAGAFDQAGAQHEAAEVLLVQADTGERFHGALELEQREGLADQFEHDRAVGELAADPADGGGEDAPVVGTHRADRSRFRRGGVVVVGPLGDHADAVEQLVALQRPDAVPGWAEGDGDPLPALVVRAGPRRQPGLQLVHHVRAAVTVVLPGEELVDVRPAGARRRRGLVHQREVTDAQPARTARVGRPVPITEGVELLHVPEIQGGLLPDVAP